MLLLLVIKAKVQPFVALLLVSLLVALAAGIPAGEVGKVMIAGMGGVLGSVTIIIGLGAMLGRMIEHSGGAESLANYFSRKLGDNMLSALHYQRNISVHATSNVILVRCKFCGLMLIAVGIEVI